MKHRVVYCKSCGCPGVAQFGRVLEWGSRGHEFESRHSDHKRIIRTVSSRWEMRSDFSFCMKSWMSTHKNRRDRILPIRAPPVDVLVVFGVFGVLFSLPVFKGCLPFCTFIEPLDLRQKDSGQCFHFKSWNPSPVIMAFPACHSPVLSLNIWLILSSLS